MGNPDLIAIVNNKEIVKIKGTEYSGVYTDDVFSLAVTKFREQINKIKKVADYPGEIESEIKKIEIFNNQIS